VEDNKLAIIQIRAQQVIYGTVIGSFALVGFIFAVKEKVLDKIKKI
tara:strand:- start:1530 stop:1667 length:138 start_codon:yes stop_codon:yes gene_type:complete